MDCMVAIVALPPSAGRPRLFVDLLSVVAQPLPEIEVPFYPPKFIDGEVCLTFSIEEIERIAQPFRFSMVLKFLQQRPSLDAMRAFIRSQWGLSHMPMVSTM